MKLKKLALLGFAAFATLSMASCGGTGAPDQDDKEKEQEKKDDPVTDEELEDYKAYVLHDLDLALAACGDLSDTTVKANVQAAYEAGKTAINSQKTVATVMAAFKSAKTAIANCIPYANGTYDFSGLSLEDRAVLTGIVENYAVRKGLTGITLYESGSYTLYNERVTLGTENYIPSYGFGTLAEGSITAPLDYESNEAWKMYYHTFETSDPGTANYWNDKGAQVGDLFGYFSGSLFTTFMNSTKDGYEWVGELAKADRPTPLNQTEDGKATMWKVAIKTGKDGIKYSTCSTKADRAKYNNREVVAEDYLTPYKIILNQGNKQYRGSEAANTTSPTIKGLKEYYNATASSTNLTEDELFEQYVQLTTEEEDGVTYLKWETTQAVTPFYAMYYITSSLFAPIPKDFVAEVGINNYASYNSDKTYTPVDNTLSTGAYVLEAWNSNQEIVFKKNQNYTYAETKYAIEGVHEKILTGIANDEDLAVKEFLAGHIDAASLTKNYLKDYASDPRCRKVAGTSSNFKLNVNACDQATWNKLFGTNGQVSVTANESDYWTCEPALSNPHFVQALSLSLDRVTISTAHGSVASASYVAAGYMADAEKGISYNNTKAHADAIAFLLEGTDGYGYSLQLAREYFKMALDELEAQGLKTPGTTDNPTVIELEIAWMYPYMEKSYHAEVKQMFENAFNDDSVTGGKYKLEVTFWDGCTTWDKVYYDKLMKGRFDLGFGSISGNTYNILDYMTCLSADQILSGGFTLNWGVDTNDPDADILVYNGVRWSFDAILAAANGETIVTNGKNTHFQTVTYDGYKANEDGTYTLTLTSTVADPSYDGTITKVTINNSEYMDRDYYLDYVEEEVAITAGEKQADGTIVYTITLDADTFSYYGHYFGLDVEVLCKDAKDTELMKGLIKTYYGYFKEADPSARFEDFAKVVTDAIDAFELEDLDPTSADYKDAAEAVSDARFYYDTFAGNHPEVAELITEEQYQKLVDAENKIAANTATAAVDAIVLEDLVADGANLETALKAVKAAMKVWPAEEDTEILALISEETKAKYASAVEKYEELTATDAE